MQSDKKRLVELLVEARDYMRKVRFEHFDCYECAEHKAGMSCQDCLIVDYLIANGVVFKEDTNAE